MSCRLLCLLSLTVAHALQGPDIDLKSSEHNDKKALARTAFVVRAASTEKDMAMMERAVAWATELHEKVPEVDFWLSVDATEDHSTFTKEDWSEVPAAGNTIIRMTPKNKLDLSVKDHSKLHNYTSAFQNAGIPVKLHVYTEKDIVTAYPSIKQAAERAGEACQGKSWCKHPLGWQFHSESLGLWWKHNNLGYDYVWVTEPDMSFNGQLSDIVESYAVSRPNKDADFMAMTVPGFPPQWMWEKSVTDNFVEKATPLPKHLSNKFSKPLLKKDTTDLKTTQQCAMVAAPEYMTKFSARLLNKMDEWCGQQGRCAHSEAFAPTVANCEGMKVGSMDPRLLRSVRHDGGPLR